MYICFYVNSYVNDQNNFSNVLKMVQTIFIYLQLKNIYVQKYCFID